MIMHFLQPAYSTKEYLNSFKYKILYIPLDGALIKPEWVEAINLFDLIISPTEIGNSILKDNKVTVSVMVLPLYFKNEDLVLPQVVRNNKITFYHESNNSLYRKGIDLMYNGFVTAFKDRNDVELVIKSRTTYPGKISSNNIKFINHFIPKKDLKELWAKADIYIGLSRIDGVGMPILRMYAFKKPIVVLENKYSGANEFLKGNFVYKVKSFYNSFYNEGWLYDLKDNSLVSAEIKDISETLITAFEDFKEQKYKVDFDQEFYHKYSYETVMKQFSDLLLSAADKIK